MFSAMLTDAFWDTSPGIPIQYRCNGKLFNPRRLQAVAKVKDTVIRDLLFADDCALDAINEQEMQLEMDGFSTPCDNFGITISIKKERSDVPARPRKPIPRTEHHSERAETPGRGATYLGSTLSRPANIDAKVTNRIAKASSAF